MIGTSISRCSAITETPSTILPDRRFSRKQTCVFRVSLVKFQPQPVKSGTAPSFHKRNEVTECEWNSAVQISIHPRKNSRASGLYRNASLKRHSAPSHSQGRTRNQTDYEKSRKQRGAPSPNPLSTAVYRESTFFSDASSGPASAALASPSYAEKLPWRSMCPISPYCIKNPRQFHIFHELHASKNRPSPRPSISYV